MHKNDNQIRDYSAVLSQKYGEPGTAERKKFDEEAYTFYTSQLLAEARREAGLTQVQLANKVNSSKSYISQLEHGKIVPSASLFFQIMNALGFEVLLHRQATNFAI